MIPEINESEQILHEPVQEVDIVPEPIHESIKHPEQMIEPSVNMTHDFDETQTQLEMLQKEEDELLAQRLAKKAQDKQKREIQESKEAEQKRIIKMKEEQDQLDKLIEQRLAEEKKLVDLRLKVEQEEKERIERQAVIEQQLAEKLKQEMMEKQMKVLELHQRNTKASSNMLSPQAESSNFRTPAKTYDKNQTSSDSAQQELSIIDRSNLEASPLVQNESNTTLLNESNNTDISNSFKVDQNLSEKKYEEYCRIMFTTAPIKFMVQKGNKEDEMIQKLIKKYKITLPIVYISEQYYLIGTQKYKAEFKYSSIILKVGSGIERFDSLVPKNQRKYQRQLIEYMSKTQKSLVEVVEMLIKGQKIYTVANNLRSSQNMGTRNLSRGNSSPRRMSQANG